jgi:outer membrane protein assembly factor BamD (BamD/ComL family)
MEKQAMPKLAHARRLLANKRKLSDAVAALEAIVKTYPDSKAATEAKKLLDKTNASLTKPPAPAAEEK